MMKLGLFMLLGMYLLANNNYAKEVLDKGYWLSPTSVAKDFSLLRLRPGHDQIVKHIRKINRSLSRVEAMAIATDIIEIADCFKIDPWLYTALIQKESSFRQSVSSPTGAVGLTQFTSIGLKEVNDQLGIRGRAGAHAKSIQYFTQKIKNCVDPSWIDLWRRVNVPEEDPEFYKLLKEEIKMDTRAAITYGAVLLKTYVARIDDKAEDERRKMQKSEIYYNALQIYNGEEGDAKVRYAKSVFDNLKKLYPNELNFPFLK